MVATVVGVGTVILFIIAVAVVQHVSGLSSLSTRAYRSRSMLESSELVMRASSTPRLATTDNEFLELNLELETYGSKEDQEVLQNALQFSQEASASERSSVEHALGVATILADMKLDLASVVAGLLQCVLVNGGDKEGEDNTRLFFQDIEQLFGTEVTFLLRNVARIDSTLISYQHQKEQSQHERENENYRKLILAMAQDIRVVLIKLADQTQRIRMLHTASEYVQKKVARETLDLYTPLAHRLGMYTLKTELEDSSLRYWKPEAFRQLQVMVAAREAQRQQYTDRVIRLLEEKLIEGGLGIGSNSTDVTGRAKSFYSIYQKMQHKNVAFDDIQDLMAFRILVNDLSQCYQALGIVHAHWKPVAGRFKDYIALSKANGYQSLHTTVIGLEGKRMEVQIRTRDMHRVAEGGIAAHWMYKDKRGSSTDQDAQRYKWLRQLVQWAQQPDDDDTKVKNTAAAQDDVFEKEVFVFSPRGQLFALTKGATVLDFAYQVHSQVGDRCVGAKVNGKMVPLKYSVENGDTVEILQSSTQKPKQEWLKIVQTTKAKQRIKSWLKREQVGEESLALGREMLEKGLQKYASKHVSIDDGMAVYKKRLPHLLSFFKLNNEQHVLRALAYGQISVPSILQEVFVASHQNNRSNQDGEDVVLGTVHETSAIPTSTPDGLVVGGKRNILTSFCRNCNALYGEDVFGVVTQGRGVKVHRLDCRYLLESDPARRVDAVWDPAAKSTKRSQMVEVLFEDGPGMLAGMSKAISSADVNIGGVVLKTLSNGQGVARFELILSSIEDLQRVTIQLKQEQGVINIKRR